MKTKIAILTIAAAVLSGCANPLADTNMSQFVKETYVSPLQFKDYSCEDLLTESEHVTVVSAQKAAIIDKIFGDFHDSTRHLAGAEVTLDLWDELKNNEDFVALSQMKGNYTAIQEAARRKGCDPIPDLVVDSEEAVK